MDAFLLENGVDTLLLESGDKLLLEQVPTDPELAHMGRQIVVAKDERLVVVWPWDGQV